ncbi:MAG: metallophosphoesterase family protein [Eubacteriales bacterium]
MKFSVFTDLHYDVIPDADKRIYELIQDCKDKKVDFIIDLGDLCNPTDENRKILDSFKDSGFPCYFSIGNNNTDFCSPETALNFFGLKKGYYSFLRENIKFVFLDANYIKTKSGFLPECKSNFKESADQCPYIPPKQIEWLKSEISDDKYYYVICSHQSLSNDHVVGTHPRGVVNKKEIREILEQRNSKGRYVLFCMNGNDHGDSIKLINGIYYYSLNSVSYVWQGVKETYNYSKEIHDKYPHLKNLILYKEPLHIIVTIDEEMNVKIVGMNGHYQNITPQDIGMGDTWNGVSIKPQTSSLYISK